MKNTNIIIYQTENENTKIETRLGNETVWLTQVQMAKQFRIWATQTLKEFIIKGFVLDEKPHSVKNVSLGKKNDTITLQSITIAS